MWPHIRETSRGCVCSDDDAYAEGRLWSHLSENWEKLHMVERSGSDTAMNSQQTPPHHLKGFDVWSKKRQHQTLWQRNSHSVNSYPTLPQKLSLWWSGNLATTPFISSDRRENSRSSPIGLGTAMTCVQSKGRLLRDQMTGWTFCMMLREMATMLQVSWRTATRLAEGSENS